MWNRTERVADVTLIITCVLAVAVFGYRLTNTRKAPRYAEGERIEENLLEQLPLANNPILLVKLSSQCEYCGLSMPALRRVLEARAAGTMSATVVVATQDDVPSLRAFLSRHDFEPDSVFDIRHTSTKLSQLPVPYTLLLGGDGRTIRSWPGLVADARAEEMIDAASRSTR